MHVFYGDDRKGTSSSYFSVLAILNLSLPKDRFDLTSHARTRYYLFPS
jgi:hypothetical protein